MSITVSGDWGSAVISSVMYMSVLLCGQDSGEARVVLSHTATTDNTCRGGCLYLKIPACLKPNAREKTLILVHLHLLTALPAVRLFRHYFPS